MVGLKEMVEAIAMIEEMILETITIVEGVQEVYKNKKLAYDN